MRRDNLTVASDVVDGSWLVYPVEGSRPGQGGDCYEVVNFGDQELKALRYANANPGLHAIYVLPGESIAAATERGDRD
ncbi:hypothetical protein [Nocardia thailandica]|uniref:hypothetical protein n=1 Tax=Nocardia thailandica TaxID=257275 RepID=UPI00030CF131|nr:hypothetical protein [Nocardia thailandica]